MAPARAVPREATFHHFPIVPCRGCYTNKKQKKDTERGQAWTPRGANVGRKKVAALLMMATGGNPPRALCAVSTQCLHLHVRAPSKSRKAAGERSRQRRWR
jgi:hypothetical protein